MKPKTLLLILLSPIWLPFAFLLLVMAGFGGRRGGA